VADDSSHGDWFLEPLSCMDTSCGDGQGVDEDCGLHDNDDRDDNDNGVAVPYCLDDVLVHDEKHIGYDRVFDDINGDTYDNTDDDGDNDRSSEHVNTDLHDYLDPTPSVDQLECSGEELCQNPAFGLCQNPAYGLGETGVEQAHPALNSLDCVLDCLQEIEVSCQNPAYDQCDQHEFSDACSGEELCQNPAYGLGENGAVQVCSGEDLCQNTAYGLGENGVEHDVGVVLHPSLASVTGLLHRGRDIEREVTTYDCSVCSVTRGVCSGTSLCLDRDVAKYDFSGCGDTFLSELTDDFCIRLCSQLFKMNPQFVQMLTQIPLDEIVAATVGSQGKRIRDELRTQPNNVDLTSWYELALDRLVLELLQQIFSA
jgi:hypothetical protein